MPYDSNGEWVDDPTQEVGGDPAGFGGENGWSVTGQNGQIPFADGHTANDNPAPSSQPKTADDFKSALGGLYDDSVYQDYQRNISNNGGGDPNDWFNRIVSKNELRANNTPGSDYHEDGKGGYLTGPKAGASSLLGGAPGGGSGGGSGSGSSSTSNPHGDEVYSYLKGLFPGGAFNQDVVNRRMDSVRGTLQAQKTQAQKNNEAYLADRGLIGSGPQATANENLESRLFGQLGSAYNDIYATESDNADKRMMGALQAATGMSESEAQNAIESFRANTERDLGFGNLALGNKNADNSFALGQGNLALGNLNANNNYALGAGGLQLDREKLAQLIRSGDTDAMQKYIQMLLDGAKTSGGGYV